MLVGGKLLETILRKDIIFTPIFMPKLIYCIKW